MGPLGAVLGPTLIYVGWSRKLLVGSLMGTFICLCTLMLESVWFILGQGNNPHFIEELLFPVAVWITAPTLPVANFVDDKLTGGPETWPISVLVAIAIVALVETAVIWVVAIGLMKMWKCVAHRNDTKRLG